MESNLANDIKLTRLISWSSRTTQMVTMMKMKVVLLLVGFVMLTEASQDVVMEMTKTFAKPLEACKIELNLSESVSTDILNFWKDGYELNDPSTGCAIICLASKLELLDPEYNLHHGKAHDFAKTHGADDGLAKQLVDLLLGCNQKNSEEQDFCWRALKVAKCFKAEIHNLNWTPSMELIVEAGDAMKFLAKGFLKVLEECKKELNLDDQLLSDLYYYWKQDYSRLSRDTGCAIICMSKKLDLLDETGKMHHGNAKEYAMAQGADADLAVKIINVIHGCEKEQDPHEDHCLWVLEVAKCFRTRIHELEWSPTMEVVIGEVLVEIS
ncbi:Pheromone binding protein 3 [Operophtera brumata]|uniref:Pheromone binding protein 3 n=1 Tax=Operophtera brumata TaxID=104452 RepID=A0A0L7KXV0_OPEBR|nr:Pheromone binding protein 3 [Operophtera brumata]